MAMRLQSFTMHSTLQRPAKFLAVVVGGLLLLFVCFLNPAPASSQSNNSRDPRDWPIYVEDSPAQQEMMEQARSLVQQKRLTEAAALYQQVIDTYGQKLAKLNDQIYISATLAAYQQIMADPALLQAYEQLYNAQAQHLIDQMHANESASLRDVTATLQDVVDRFYLTGAGLDAAMELASRELEAAQPSAALSILQLVSEHPALPTRKMQWHGLLAAAAVFGGHDQDAASQRAQLVAMGPEASSWVERLDQWIKLRVVPDVPVVSGAVREQTMTKLPESYRSPLWRVQLDGDQDKADAPGDERAPNVNPQVNNRRVVLRGGLRGGQQPEDALQQVMLPLERQGVLYLNEAENVLALDVHSGRVIWRVKTEVFNELTSRNLPFRLFQPDVRGVALYGNNVAAVVGRMSSMPGRMGSMVKPTRVVVFDAKDGAVRFTIDPMSLEDPLEGLNFHGTPIESAGRLYVLGRRSRITGFHTEYLFSFDAHTGKQLWRRHLASANAPANRRSVYPMGQILFDRGRLYIADNLGAVSCVDTLTGSILWLAHGKTIPSVLDAIMGRVASASLLMGCPPIMTRQGLLVAPASPGQSAVLLDPATGLVVRELNQQQWGQSDYLVKVGDDVYSVGQHVQRFDGSTLTRKWGVALNARGKVNMQGRAAFTKNYILLPVNNRLVVLDLNKGTMVMQPELSLSGSLMALESQVVVASSAEVGGFMSWQDAYAKLSKQIADNPADPTPAMALAHLAGESDQPVAMLKAVDLAIAAVHRQTAAALLATPQDTEAAQAPQRDIFEQIIELARTAGSKTAASRRGLYDRLAVVTSDLGDEVTYHLMFGDFLVEMKDYAQAADQYQYILNDQILSQQLYIRDNVARQGGLEARVRLKSLIAKYGLSTYRNHEVTAATRLVQLTAPGTQTDPQDLIDLARQYPVSRSAGPALIAAADRLDTLGRPNEAMRQLRAAYELSNEAGVLQRAIGKMVTLYLAQNQPRQARTWLLLAKRRGIDPLRDGKPVLAQLWLADVSGLDGLGNSEMRLPQMHLPLGQPRLIEAGLLTPREQPQYAWPLNLMMTRSSRGVQLRRGPSWEPVWESPTPDGEVELLWLTQDRALLWLTASHELLSLDVATGKPLWDPVDVISSLKPLGGIQQKWDARSAQRRQFEGWMDAGGVVFRNGRLEVAGSKPREGVMISVNEMVICAVDGIGRATAIDRHTGRVLWRRILPMDQVSLIQMDDQTLAAGGVNGVRVGAEGGALILVDPLTGELVLESAIEDKRPLNWIGLSAVGSNAGQADGGLVFFSTGQELVAHRVRDGQVVWRLPVKDKNFTGTASLVEDSLLMQDTQGSMWVIDAPTGKLRNRVSFPMVQGVGTWIQPTHDAWQIATQSQAASLTLQGKVRWRDGLGQLPGQVIVAQWVSQPLLGVLTVNGVNPFETAEARIRQGLVQPMPGVRINFRNQQALQQQLALRAAAIKNLPKPAAMAAHDGNYELLMLDRVTGKVVSRQTLHFEGRPLQLNQALTLDNTLVIGDASVTILIPAAAR